MKHELIQNKIEFTETELQKAELDGYEIMLYQRSHALSRYANSTIHQQVQTDATWVRLRGFIGKKLQVVQTTGTEENIKKAVEELKIAVRNAPELGYFHGFIDKQNYQSVKVEAKLMDPDERAELIGRIIDRSNEIDPKSKVFGKVETLDFKYGIVNSNGVRGYHNFGYNDIKILSIVETNGNRGYGREVIASMDPKSIDAEKLTTSAVKIAQDASVAKSAEIGDYTVILRPQALTEMVGFTIYGLSANIYHQANSPFTDKLGEQVLSEKLTISDKPLSDNNFFASPFDGEGVAKRNIPLIENGIPKVIMYDTLTASQYLEDKSLVSGHSILPYSDYIWSSISPMNLDVKSGDSSEQEMIEDTKRGILVQTFWYTNPVNPKEGILTGLTRDGLYLIEDGEIKYAIKNMRYTDSILNFFSEIDLISKMKRPIIDSDGGFTNSPVIKLAKMKFTGQSKH